MEQVGKATFIATQTYDGAQMKKYNEIWPTFIQNFEISRIISYYYKKKT